MKRRKTVLEFIKESNLKHGNSYCYNKSIYTNNSTKCIIICSIHGEFLMSPAHHLKGRGCQACSKEALLKSSALSEDNVLSSFIAIHGNKYSYDMSGYVNGGTKIKINCPDHGYFMQSPSHHKRGYGCKECGITESSKKQSRSLSNSIIKFKSSHGDRYDYSKVNYINAKTKVVITCRDHGDFYQTPDLHSRGYGCNKCANETRNDWKKHTTQSFISKSLALHKEKKYDYSLVKYVNNYSKVKIICKTHGVFNQNAASHLLGTGCPSCATTGFNRYNSGFVYILVSEDNLKMKIGITNNIKTRTRKLRKATPFSFFVLLTKNFDVGGDAYDCEQHLHKKFTSSNLTGFDGCTEWFNYDDSVISDLDKWSA